MSTPSTPITVGIVGLGRAGWHLHFTPLQALQGCFKIVAVADPATERAQEASAETGCAIFSNIDELLAGSDAQVVVVATPSNTHYSDIKKVLNAGRHCIAEKPVALSQKDADELVALAAETGLKLFIHHVHLHKAEYNYLQSVVDSGILGPIFHVQGNWQGYARRWDWQTLRKNGGGQLNNTCPHTLSVILPLLGSRVIEVNADLRNIKDAGDAEDHANVFLKTENGTTGSFIVSTAIALPGPRWTVCGKYGTLQSDGTKAKLRYYNPAEAADLTVLDGAAPGRKYLTETLNWIEKELEIPECPVADFHRNAYDVISCGAKQIVSPEGAADVVRVTEMAMRAAGVIE